LNVERYGQDSDERGAILDTHTYNTTRTRDRNSDRDDNWFHYVDAWDFSFFSTELTKHYEQLRVNVFRPLANLNLVSKSEYRDYIHEIYTLEITNMPSETSKIYQLALKHMNEDNSQIPKEIESLKKKLKVQDDPVNQLKKDIDESIEQKFTTTSSTPMNTGGNKYDYNHDYVYKLLTLVWQPHSASQTISERINKFIKDPKNAYREEHNQYFYFSGKPLGRGSDDEFNQMKTELFSIVSDSVLVSKIISIQNSEADLHKRIIDIKKLVDPIIDLIDQDLYGTRVKKCCPTLWSLIRKYT
jgi:hypothetical protein